MLVEGPTYVDILISNSNISFAYAWLRLIKDWIKLIKIKPTILHYSKKEKKKFNKKNLQSLSSNKSKKWKEKKLLGQN